MLETVQKDLKVGNCIGKIGLHAADLPKLWVWCSLQLRRVVFVFIACRAGRLGNQAWSRGVFVQ